MSRLAMLALPLLPMAGCRSVDKPQAPDMTRLVQAYENPDGDLTQGVADEVRAAWTTHRAELHEIGIDTTLDGLFAKMRDHVEEDDSSTDNNSDVDDEGDSIVIEGAAVLTLTEICRGWGAEKVVDERANGNVRLHANVTNLTVDPVVWMTFNRCRKIEDGLPVEVGRGAETDVGDVRIFVGQNLSLKGLGFEPIVIDVDVSARHGAFKRDIRFDVRLNSAQESAEYRTPGEGGDVVVVTQDDRIVAVRAANGLFKCTEEARCENAQGELVAF